MSSRNQAHKSNDGLQAILFILLCLMVLLGSVLAGPAPTP